MARQLHAALEGLQRLIERQVAALQALDQRLELGQRLLEIEVSLLSDTQAAHRHVIDRAWQARGQRD